MGKIFADENIVSMLRSRAESVEAELRRRDVAEDADRVAHEAATAAEIERHRVGAWWSYNTDKAMAGGHGAFIASMDVPSEIYNARMVSPGWPPGTSPEDAVLVDVPEGEDLSGTELGKIFAKHGARL